MSLKGFLALTFEDAEVIAIGLNIAIKVHLRQGRRRKFIVCAPAEVSILRSEIKLEEEEFDEEEVTLEEEFDDSSDEETRDDYGNLTLTRKKGEAIDFWVAGEKIGTVVLVRNGSTNVRLAFQFLGGREGDYKILRQKFFLETYQLTPLDCLPNTMLRKLVAEAAA